MIGPTQLLKEKSTKQTFPLINVLYWEKLDKQLQGKCLEILKESPIKSA